MDGRQFDALVTALKGVGSRRVALGGLLGSASALAGWIGNSADAHNNWSRCKNIPSKAKRAKCVKKGAAHKKWHESNACRGEGQKCGDRPCCAGLVCSGSGGTCGKVLGTTPGKPGGLWITPSSGFQVNGDTLNFEARAYKAKATDPPISYVNFTAKPDGKDWKILCTDYTPASGTDRYGCSANLRSLGIPEGPLTVSFDVYDAAGGYTLAPHGKRVGTYRTRYFVPYPKSETDWRQTDGDHVAWQFGDGWNGKARDYAPAANGQAIRTDRSVLAVAGGKVVRTNPSQYWLAIDHENGEISFYLHVANIKVSEGAPVTSNTVLGNPSALGGIGPTGVHVHLAFATYNLSAPPKVGEWNPNQATWARTFPALGSR